MNFIICINRFFFIGIHKNLNYLFTDGPDSAALLGTLDTSFLFCYGVAMFMSGFVAERVSLRYFLTFGMLFSAIFTYLFGIAKTYDIHSMWYFVFVQAMAGIFQTTGWPGVVTILGRWFGKSKRGLIFGIWNSHTSIGNILGTFVAAHYVESDWSMSFIVPGLIMGICGFILFLFLVDSPDIVGCQERDSRRNSISSNYRAIEEGASGSDEEIHSERERSIVNADDQVGSINGMIDRRFCSQEKQPCDEYTKLVCFAFHEKKR